MANQVIVGALFLEGTSQVRPPYFNGQHFSHWKVRMEISAKYYDVKIWRVIKKGNYPLPAAAQPAADPEDIDEYIDEQMAVVQVNTKARNLLYNAISGEEYEKISSCDTAKEMWDKLEVTYEGTSKVKETHIKILVHDYELFQMKEGESIEEMFAIFSKIINYLKAFGKLYSSGDQVRKILRSLPTTWQTKVVTLESQDFNKLSYDELRGELIAFEKTHLKKTNQEEKKKTVAFKATTERTDNDIDDDPEYLQEEIAMVSRNMDGLMRRYRNTKRGRIPPRRTRQYNEQDKNDGKCYECGRFGHVQAECPELKRKGAGQTRTSQMMIAKMTTTIVSWHEVKQARNTTEGVTKENGYEVKFKKTGYAIEDEIGKVILPEESVHVIFDENNTSAEKGITAGDENQTQVIQETSNSQESTNKLNSVVESTNEISNSQSEPPEESTTHTVSPNEWRSELEYPQKFIIGDQSEGIKTRGALKKKANTTLISQIEPKKIEEALKDSSWMQAMQEDLDQF
uniref:CCHC-type domain-containing protein n=1 Tax=Nicotiana tabacum TaxID=4097 RepID=A0A1S3ZF66_TOBAC|nr:PREDICTED: uncharacterized protein LOC107786007 [Nicotiana tabacum]